MTNKYSAYYPLVERNRQYFEQALKELSKLQDPKKQFSLACYAASFATFHNTGYFTSSVLENFFTNYAQTLHTDLTGLSPQPNSFLHVLTEGYETGGHTRVVERWINYSPRGQKHSVVILNPRFWVFLKTLHRYVKQHHGEFISFSRRHSLEQRALQLRKLAMQYQYVILHTHMQDPTALLAFGTEEFTRPVFLYNHASHMFWLGRNIADKVLDLCANDRLTIQTRGIEDPIFLGVPSLPFSFNTPDKKLLRKKLHLPPDKKIIISAGAESKYTSIGEDSFLRLVQPLLDEHTFLYLIGVPNTGPWKQLYNSSDKHIIPLGYIHFNQGYLDYIACADLFIDSYPIGGGAACIDAISVHVPVLSRRAAFPQFDYLTHTQAYCQTDQEFIKKARKVLSDPAYAAQIHAELQESLIKEQSPQAWQKRLEDFLHTAPTQHRVILNSSPTSPDITDLAVLDNAISNTDFFNHTGNQPPFVPIEQMLKNGSFFIRTDHFPFGITLDVCQKDGRNFYILKWNNRKLLKIPW